MASIEHYSALRRVRALRTVIAVCERNGKRKCTQADGVKNKRGGHRIKGEKKNLSARHPDALPARASRIAKSEERFSAKAGEG